MNMHEKFDVSIAFYIIYFSEEVINGEGGRGGGREGVSA